MPTIVCKITEDDGTEVQYGPYDVESEVAESVIDALSPGDEQFWTDAIEYHAAVQEQVNVDRSEEAAAANQARIEAAERGEEVV